jgi:hypothetical protein
MDAQETLVFNSTVTAAVLGRGEQFALVYLPYSQAEAFQYGKEGFRYAGVVGLLNGKVEIVSEPDLEARILTLLAALRFAQDLIPSAANDDSVEWLTKLHALEDPREKFGPAS